MDTTPLTLNWARGLTFPYRRVCNTCEHYINIQSSTHKGPVLQTQKVKVFLSSQNKQQCRTPAHVIPIYYNSSFANISQLRSSRAQKKTTSVSLTIGPSSPKCGITTAIMQPISIPVQQVQSPTSYLYRQDGSGYQTFSPPSFTKELQSLTASEGQVVVLECRVKGSPPANVKWFRQGTEIQDSPDFRILQKSKTQS
ncbi:unnamed protein product [Ranitomeya imitator]|uniref:Ig-like domain-containing protein n=1 Tax=Ranitomeya imitator TaxID=111125 RepID=A0ABN9LXE4_9NEOB|nr:unnamed protein product [Ranitomeya imitator]